MISCRNPPTEARNAFTASTKAVLPSTVSALPRRMRTSSVMCAASVETSLASNAAKIARAPSDGLTRFNAPATSVLVISFSRVSAGLISVCVRTRGAVPLLRRHRVGGGLAGLCRLSVAEQCGYDLMYLLLEVGLVQTAVLVEALAGV